tara:strand:- start:739 stop:1020 length:282 start_codon:yes stop_codon:yes gene_type:complete
MADSISLEQIQEQQSQLSQTVSNLVAQKATLEEQLESCKATLASNQGALQYANALIQSLTEGEDAAQVGEGNVSQDIEVPTETETVEAEAVTL